MLFKPELADKIIRGTKTQTRRVVGGNDTFTRDGALYDRGLDWLYVERNGRLLWSRGRTYAVCPGRGKSQVARIRITDIRQECVGDISEADATAEGFASRDEFLRVFKAINPKSDLFTPVWVLSFELVS